MPCDEFEEAILDDLEGYLDPGRRRELERHLTRCTRCREFRATQQDLGNALSRALEPPRLRAGFRRRLEARIEAERTRPRLPWFPELLDAIGVLAVGAAVLIIDERYARVVSAMISSFSSLK